MICMAADGRRKELQHKSQLVVQCPTSYSKFHKIQRQGRYKTRTVPYLPFLRYDIVNIGLHFFHKDINA